MTLQKKTIPFVFAFAALMLAWPLTAQTANADGSASLDADCPVDFPSSINFGAFAIGSDDAEVALTAMTTGGTKAGTLEIDAEDWEGQGEEANGSIVLENVVATDAVTINSVLYTAVASGAGANEFDVGVDDTATAVNLASQINTEDTATLDATSSENAVFIVTDAIGTAGNSIAMSTSDTTLILSGSTLSGGEADNVVHMAAEVTHYTITTDGTSITTDATTYSQKLAFETEANGNKVIAGSTQIDQDVEMVVQISGDGTLTNLPYSGALDQAIVATVTCVA